jgi:hypothetical protein
VKVVDVRNPAAPLVVGSVDFDGAVSDTRIVGDVLYVVANRWAWYGAPSETGATDDLVVRSIDLSAPSAPVLRESLSFPGTSNVIHVSPTTLYVASSDWSDWQHPRTTVRVVDIDDPQGALRETGALEVDGARRVFDLGLGGFRLGFGFGLGGFQGGGFGGCIGFVPLFPPVFHKFEN